MQKKLRYKLTLYPDFDNHRILNSAWMRHTTSQIQPKVVVSDPTFPSWLSPCKKLGVGGGGGGNPKPNLET